MHARHAVVNTERAATSDARRRRAMALTALALIAIAVAAFVYLRPTPTSPPPVQAPAINPLQVSSTPVDYAFVTPSTGWAALLVVGPSLDSRQFVLFRTTDGARHWQQQLIGQSSPGFTPGSYLPISVQFFGKTDGFMTLGRPIEHLYRTIDGG